MTITITHRGTELTPPIKAYVEEKMGSLTKYMDSIRHMDIEVGVTNHHHHKGDIFECKAVVQIGGEILHFVKEEDDLYKAIDLMRDHVREELTDWKAKQQDRSRGSGAGETLHSDGDMDSNA